MAKLLLATADAFTKAAKFVGRGEVVSADEVDWKDGDAGFVPAPSGVDGNPVVEVSAIAPTGPNPRNPQQVAPGTIQTPAGWVDQGATLVGEVTVREKERFAEIDVDDDTQAKIAEALAKADEDEPKRAAKTAARQRRTDAENSG